MVELRDSSLAHGLVIMWFVGVASVGSWFIASSVARSTRGLSAFTTVFSSSSGGLTEARPWFEGSRLRALDSGLTTFRGRRGNIRR